MSLVDGFGIFLSAVMAGGFLWALVDLLVKIRRQPKKTGPIDLTRLSSYPLVPEMIKQEKPRKRSYPKELIEYK
ncbi:MAG: hypothetical protein KAH97_02980 [Anaerolineales bacterium]|nr:hypothetical protein [Anaerolineales bacterium]